MVYVVSALSPEYPDTCIDCGAQLIEDDAARCVPCQDKAWAEELAAKAAARRP